VRLRNKLLLLRQFIVSWRTSVDNRWPEAPDYLAAGVHGRRRTTMTTTRFTPYLVCGGTALLLSVAIGHAQNNAHDHPSAPPQEQRHGRGKQRRASTR